MQKKGIKLKLNTIVINEQKCISKGIGTYYLPMTNNK